MVEIPQLQNYPSTKISEYRMRGGNVVVKGRIMADDAEAIRSMDGQIKAIVRNSIVKTQTTTLFDIQDDGTFQANLYVPYPTYVYVLPYANVFMCPGDTIDIAIDTESSTRDERYVLKGTGVSGEVNRVTDKVHKTYCNFDYYDYDILENQPLDSLLRWRDVQVSLLDDNVRHMNDGMPELKGLSPLASDIVRTSILCAHLQHLYTAYIKYTDFSSTFDYDEKGVWRQYFSVLHERENMLVDNPLLMLCGDDILYNYLEFGAFYPVVYHNTITEEIPMQYKPELDDFDEPIDEPIPSRREAFKWAARDIRDNLNVGENNFSLQVCMLNLACGFLNANSADTDNAAEVMAAVMPHITHPELARWAMLRYREYIKKNELMIEEEEHATKADTIFQRIIEPYKGNVLYIDFWEIGCGPCRATMLNMRDEVEANKDKPVKYLYITDNTEEECRHFLQSNNIKGEHIYISRSEWGYLQAKFNFSGIPFTMLYDKKGNSRQNITIEELIQE